MVFNLWYILFSQKISFFELTIMVLSLPVLSMTKFIVNPFSAREFKTVTTGVSRLATASKITEKSTL